MDLFAAQCGSEGQVTTLDMEQFVAHLLERDPPRPLPKALPLPIGRQWLDLAPLGSRQPLNITQKHPLLAIGWPDVEPFALPRSSRTRGYGRQNRFPSRKIRRVMRAASDLEMRFLTHCEIDPSVVYFCEQPFRFYYQVPGNRRRRYTPDAMLTRPGGHIDLIEVKYEADAAIAENEDRWSHIGAAANAAGIGFQVITERHMQAADTAVIDVFRNRHAKLPVQSQLRLILVDVGSRPTPASEIESRFGLSAGQVKALIRCQYLQFADRILPYSSDPLLQAAHRYLPTAARN